MTDPAREVKKAFDNDTWRPRKQSTWEDNAWGVFILAAIIIFGIALSTWLSLIP